MKILMLHNYYQQSGGEDQSFHAEADVLERYSHSVERYVRHNNEIDHRLAFAAGANAVWNQKSFKEVLDLIDWFRPDVLHAQNLFPLISPSVYYASWQRSIPVVQSVRNYRMFCLNGSFFRDGHVCEDCNAHALPWPGLLHGCYRGSRLASGCVATVVTAHRLLQTWHRRIDIFIALSEFTRQKCIEGGLPRAKIEVKPNFLQTDPGVGSGDGGYALYVGRLSPEKGVRTLMKAWRGLEDGPRLLVVGGGPLLDELAKTAIPRVEFLGHRSTDEVLNLLKGAAVLIFPSECYETFGRVAIEAYATGTPVLASRIGAITELIEDGRTGCLFTAGDPDHLAAIVASLWRKPELLRAMRRSARATFEAKYTAEANYGRLMNIYEKAVNRIAPT
jgi:glycosyltransferase involved in cell wall biosynthesis